MKNLLLTAIAAVLVVGVVSRSSRLLKLNQLNLLLKCQHSHRLHHQKHNLLNPLPKLQHQNRRQPKHETSQFTKLPEQEILKPSNSTWLLGRM